MKIRNGFVSNSSSASFVICWRFHDPENKDIKNIVQDIVAPYLDLYLNPSYPSDANTDYCKRLSKEIDCIVNSTSWAVEVGGETYLETLGYTSMYNDHQDFSDFIRRFVFALVVAQIENKVKIIDQSIVGD